MRACQGASCSESDGDSQAALERQDLWREVAILERLIYKNRSQHRSSVHFRRLLEVTEHALIM